MADLVSFHELRDRYNRLLPEYLKDGEVIRATANPMIGIIACAEARIYRLTKRIERLTILVAVLASSVLSILLVK